MTTIIVSPMPEKIRKIPKKWRPLPPPVFQDIGPGGITQDDRELARELFQLLDDESKGWYKGL